MWEKEKPTVRRWAVAPSPASIDLSGHRPINGPGRCLRASTQLRADAIEFALRPFRQVRLPKHAGCVRNRQISGSAFVKANEVADGFRHRCGAIKRVDPKTVVQGGDNDRDAE